MAAAVRGVVRSGGVWSGGAMRQREERARWFRPGRTETLNRLASNGLQTDVSSNSALTGGPSCLKLSQQWVRGETRCLPQKWHLLVKITRSGTYLLPLPQKWYVFVIYSVRRAAKTMTRNLSKKKKTRRRSGRT